MNRLFSLHRLTSRAALLHQIIDYGRIDVDQVVYHEFFAGLLISFGLVVHILKPRLSAAPSPRAGTPKNSGLPPKPPTAPVHQKFFPPNRR